MPDYAARLERLTPTETGPPTFNPVGQLIAPSGVTWTRVLNRPGEQSLTIEPGAQPGPIRTELENLIDDNADVPRLILTLWRDAQRVMRGPVLGATWTTGDQDTPLVTLRATSMLAMLAYMELRTADIVVDGIDQYALAALWTDQWQNLNWRHLGIDTSTVGTSGQTRQGTWLVSERHNVLQRVTEIGDRDNGYDLAVDDNGVLVLAAELGSDLSATVVFVAGRIPDPGIDVSVAPGDIATDVLGVSTADDGTVLTRHIVGQTVLETFGGAAASETWDGVANQSTLNDHTSRFRASRNRPIVASRAVLLPYAHAEATSFAPGDTIKALPNLGLTRTIPIVRRVLSQTVTVTDGGDEELTVEFA